MCASTSFKINALILRPDPCERGLGFNPRKSNLRSGNESLVEQGLAPSSKTSTSYLILYNNSS